MAKIDWIKAKFLKWFSPKKQDYIQASSHPYFSPIFQKIVRRGEDYDDKITKPNDNR